MKLATIRQPKNVEYDGLRILLGDNPDSLIESIVYRIKHGNNNRLRVINPTLPYLFVESVRQTGVISEASAFDAVVEKIRAAITPGPSGDLGYLLSMMAPNVKQPMVQIKKLLDTAGSFEGDLMADQGWWMDLGAVFGYSGEDITAVQQQVQTDLLGQQPEPEPQPQPQDPNYTVLDTNESGQGPVEAQPKKSGLNKLASNIRSRRGRGSDLDALQAERGANDEHISKLRAAIDKTSASRAEAQKKLDAIMAKMEKMDALNRESIVRDLSLTLLEDPRVQRNIHQIANLTVQKLADRHRIQVPMIKEEGLLDKVKEALRNTRTNVANPGRAKRQAAEATAQPQANPTNIRAAKLAIQAFTDVMKAEFKARLEGAKPPMTPENIVNAIKIYQKDPRNQEAKKLLIKAKELVEAGKPKEPAEEKVADLNGDVLEVPEEETVDAELSPGEGEEWVNDEGFAAIDPGAGDFLTEPEEEPEQEDISFGDIKDALDGRGGGLGQEHETLDDIDRWAAAAAEKIRLGQETSDLGYESNDEDLQDDLQDGEDYFDFEGNANDFDAEQYFDEQNFDEPAKEALLADPKADPEDTDFKLSPYEEDPSSPPAEALPDDDPGIPQEGEWGGDGTDEISLPWYEQKPEHRQQFGQDHLDTLKEFSKRYKFASINDATNFLKPFSRNPSNLGSILKNKYGKAGKVPARDIARTIKDLMDKDLAENS